MVRSKDEVDEDIDATKARIEALKDDLSGIGAEIHELEDDLAEQKDKAQKTADKLQIEEARLANLDVERQSSG